MKTTIFSQIFTTRRKLTAWILIFGLVLAALPSAGRAQETPAMRGRVLIRTLEIGATATPDRFFWADVETRTVRQIVVENQPVFVSWFGWSPDGSAFAFLAPSRDGVNNELWLYDANGGNGRSPLFRFDMRPVSAAWNPVYNIIALGVTEARLQNGLFLYNVAADNPVFALETSLEADGNQILDWSPDGNRVAYNAANSDIFIYDTQTRAASFLATNEYPTELLSPLDTGWTADASAYLFSEVLFHDAVYAYSTDGAGGGILSAVESPYGVLGIYPAGHDLLAWRDGVLTRVDVRADEGTPIPLSIPGEIDLNVMLTADESLIVNTIQEDATGRYAECYITDPDGSNARAVGAASGNIGWRHSRCRVLEGGAMLAVQVSDSLTHWDQLPDEQRYSLFLVAADMGYSTILTLDYAGLEVDPPAYSSDWQQIIFREGAEVVAYRLDGARFQLISLRDLDLQSSDVLFEFAWQPG